MADKYVMDFVHYHTGKDGKRTRYAPGTPLPAEVAKGIHPKLLRKATAAELKASGEAPAEPTAKRGKNGRFQKAVKAEPEMSPPDSGDVDKSQK